MTPNPSYEADSRLASQTLIVRGRGGGHPKMWGSVNLDGKKFRTLLSVTPD
jgi:hypothetical protein